MTPADDRDPRGGPRQPRSAHDEVDELARHDDDLDDLRALEVLRGVPGLRAGERLELLAGRPAGASKRSRTLPLTWRTISVTVSRSSSDGSAAGHGSSHTRRPVSRVVDLGAAVCGAKGKISEAAVAAAKCSASARPRRGGGSTR